VAQRTVFQGVRWFIGTCVSGEGRNQVTQSKTSRLKSQGRAAVAALEGALSAHRQFAEEAARVIEELEHDAAIRENSVTEDAGMHSLDLLAWLCSDIRADQVNWHSGMVGTAGSGPWPIGEFDNRRGEQ
jgi:hypothetical protein